MLDALRILPTIFDKKLDNKTLAELSRVNREFYWVIHFKYLIRRRITYDEKQKETLQTFRIFSDLYEKHCEGCDKPKLMNKYGESNYNFYECHSVFLCEDCALCKNWYIDDENNALCMECADKYNCSKCNGSYPDPEYFGTGDFCGGCEDFLCKKNALITYLWLTEYAMFVTMKDNEST